MANIERAMKKDIAECNRKNRQVVVSDNSVLLCALADISSMCVGDIAMGYKLDASYIGELIYKATGMTQPELHEHTKKGV